MMASAMQYQESIQVGPRDCKSSNPQRQILNFKAQLLSQSKQLLFQHPEMEMVKCTIVVDAPDSGMV
jgi:hypothetical protein